MGWGYIKEGQGRLVWREGWGGGQREEEVSTDTDTDTVTEGEDEEEIFDPTSIHPAGWLLH